MSDDLLTAALNEAWDSGYQLAVNALRKMADQFEDKQAKALIGTLADALKAIKP